MFALLALWRRVVKFIRSIGLALSKGSKIVWSKKIKEATDIANDYLDMQGRPQLGSKLSDSSDGDQNTSQEEVKPRTRLLRRRR